jgi:type III secretion protein S
MYHLCLDALMLMVVLSAVPMAAVGAAAGLVGLVQAVTQVQEQSISHLARCIAFGAVVLAGGALAGAEVQALFVRVLEVISVIGRE